MNENQEPDLTGSDENIPVTIPELEEILKEDGRNTGWTFPDNYR